jgi:hypothetical protein
MKTTRLGTHVSGVLFSNYGIRLRHASGVPAATAVFELMLILCLGFSLGFGAVAAQDKPSTISRPRIAVPASRKVFVHSSSLLVSAAVVEDKLLKLPEFQQRGFVITRDVDDADLVIELRHDVLTKYVFTVIDVKSRIVLAGGKLSSLGGTVADKVAKRFIKEISGLNQP